LLRQIGKPLAGRRLHGAGHRFHDADDPFHQGGFARSVRADHRGQRAAFDRAVQVVDGRVAAIAKGQVAKGQAGVAHCHVRRDRRRCRPIPSGYVMLLRSSMAGSDHDRGQRTANTQLCS
jgi:hypothetical protein